MAVKTKLEKNPDGGFSIVIEEDGSGDLNRIMGELCQKHKEAKERGEGHPQTGKEICQEILHAIRGEEEATLDAELDKFDID